MPKINKPRQGDLIITSITEEQPEDDQDYYREHRGPIILVRGLQTDIKLSFIPNEEEDDESFACEYLEPFSATSRTIDKKCITLRNEGTTAIRCQWLRFPPNNETEFLLANPAGSIVTGGGRHGKTGRRKRLNDEKVSKLSCHQFRFRELPSVLLPGQSMEFTIVFRSDKHGYFYENLYLITHPKLRDAEGRGYSLRLTGICMDPEFMETESNKPRPENIHEIMNQITFEQEAKDLMDSVLDHALFIEPDHPSTLPYLKVTSESIFYTHNKNLKYYFEIAQKSLDTVRQIIELLVPQERIERNEKACTLSIESLYQLLWTRNSSRDLYWAQFKTNETEKLLSTLANYNNILIQPRRYSYCSAASRKVNSSYASLVALMDQILEGMEYIDDLYSTPALQDIYIDISIKKYESGKLDEKEETNIWDFAVFIPQLSEEILEMPSEDTNGVKAVEVEEEAEVPLQDVNEPIFIEASISKKTVQDSKKKKVKKTDTVANLGKKWKKKSKKDKDDADPRGLSLEGEELFRQNSVMEEEILGESPTPTPTSVPPPPPPPPPTGSENTGENEGPNSTAPLVDDFIVDDERLKTVISQRLAAQPPAVQEQFLQEKKRRIYQAKRMVFEDLLAQGIERIICAVDAFNAMEDYRQSEYSSKPNVSTNYCCSD